MREVGEITGRTAFDEPPSITWFADAALDSAECP